jgi:hypothetical protein
MKDDAKHSRPYQSDKFRLHSGRRGFNRLYDGVDRSPLRRAAAKPDSDPIEPDMRVDLLASPATWDALSKTGKAYFDALVEHLCNVTGVAVAFVVESVDLTGERVCPLASWGVEHFRDGRCYDTLGTPCERLRRGGPSVFPDHLAERFPNDRWLSSTGMRSYVGLPLLDAGGSVLGHLGVLDDQPMTDPQGIAAILEAFVLRSGSRIAGAWSTAATGGPPSSSAS